MLRSKPVEIAGWVAVLAILAGYLLVAQQLVAPTDWRYLLLNLVGSSFLVWETLGKRDYQPAVLNIAWVVITISAFVRLMSW